MPKLKDYATMNVTGVPADASIDDAIKLLHSLGIRHLPVVCDGGAVGMVSEGDVLVAVGGVLSEHRVPSDATVAYAGPTHVEQIMTQGVVTLRPDQSIDAAARLMLEHQISAVVLVEDESIVGIVTETDYLRLFSEDNGLISESHCLQPVADHMTKKVATTTPTESVFTIIRRMGKRMRHLPVVSDGKLVGILSGHDVRRALALDNIERIKHPDQRIRLMEDFDASVIMKTEIETTTRAATLRDAATQMIEHKIGALPVVEDGELLGIVTETDLLQVLVKALG